MNKFYATHNICSCNNIVVRLIYMQASLQTFYGSKLYSYRGNRFRLELYFLLWGIKCCLPPCLVKFSVIKECYLSFLSHKRVIKFTGKLSLVALLINELVICCVYFHLTKNIYLHIMIVKTVSVGLFKVWNLFCTVRRRATTTQRQLSISIWKFLMHTGGYLRS